MNVKSYEFLFLQKNMSKTFSSKYGQKLHDTTRTLITSARKTSSKKAIQKTTIATGDLVGNKIAGKIAKATSKSTR